MLTVDADGTPIHVEIEGPEDAPALMFSNSLGTNLHMWDEQAKAFAKNFRVVRYDQRGHGQSGAPEGPYSMDRHGLDALAIMNQLGISKVHWCGLSMGGMTGMWLGRHAPERIGKLVLSNTAAKSLTPEAWNTRIRTIHAKGLPAVADTVLGIWFTKEFRERASDIVARLREMMLSTNPQGYVGCASGIRDMDQRWGIGSINLPTLIIAGRHDQGTTLKDAELIASRIAGSQLEILDAAHISNIELSIRFTETVQKFLKG